MHKQLETEAYGYLEYMDDLQADIKILKCVKGEFIWILRKDGTDFYNRNGMVYPSFFRCVEQKGKIYHGDTRIKRLRRLTKAEAIKLYKSWEV